MSRAVKKGFPLTARRTISSRRLPWGEGSALVGGEPRRDEEDPVEAQAFPDLLRQGQVGRVHGIEGASEDAQALPSPAGFSGEFMIPVDHAAQGFPGRLPEEEGSARESLGVAVRLT